MDAKQPTDPVDPMEETNTTSATDYTQRLDLSVQRMIACRTTKTNNSMGVLGRMEKHNKEKAVFSVMRELHEQMKRLTDGLSPQRSVPRH